jgi:DNA mismatch endonuclease (patch repair protein)
MSARFRKPSIERSSLMARIKRVNTAPEVALRKALHRAGFRYRLRSGHRLPGRPDIVLARFRIAIFVDGCFWHGCRIHGSRPKTNSSFWATKIATNKKRDARCTRVLRRLGWIVIRAWEHQINQDVHGVVAVVAARSRSAVFDRVVRAVSNPSIS